MDTWDRQPRPHSFAIVAVLTSGSLLISFASDFERTQGRRSQADRASAHWSGQHPE